MESSLQLNYTQFSHTVLTVITNAPGARSSRPQYYLLSMFDWKADLDEYVLDSGYIARRVFKISVCRDVILAVMKFIPRSLGAPDTHTIPLERLYGTVSTAPTVRPDVLMGLYSLFRVGIRHLGPIIMWEIRIGSTLAIIDRVLDYSEGMFCDTFSFAVPPMLGWAISPSTVPGMCSERVTHPPTILGTSLCMSSNSNLPLLPLSQRIVCLFLV